MDFYYNKKKKWKHLISSGNNMYINKNNYNKRFKHLSFQADVFRKWKVHKNAIIKSQWWIDFELLSNCI